MNRPAPTAAARLVKLAREAAGISAAQAARDAGISAGRWSQVETGSYLRGGVYRPANPSPPLLARMATAVGVSPQRMATDGARSDVAQIMAERLGQAPSPAADDFPLEPALAEAIRAVPHDQVRAALASLSQAVERILSEQQSA